MSLTADQIVALRAACFANGTAAAFFQSPGNSSGLHTWLNGNDSVNAWRTDANVTAILDAINWSNYTPNDVVAGADVDPLLSVKIARLLTVQTKQMNLQLMLQGRDRLNTAPTQVRAGLRDAVIAVPTGLSGANTSPGGVSGATVLAACVRTATRAEVMLAAAGQASDTTGTTTARVLTWQGIVQSFQATGLIFRDDGTLWTP